MIIPVRCFTCNKVLADVWEDFIAMSAEEQKDDKKATTEEGFTPERLGDILKRLGITRICCKRHMLSHVDLVEYI